MSFVIWSSGIDDVISRLSMENVQPPVVFLCASMYDSCWKSDPERRIGIPFTV
jgi:hypothetical protein